MRTGQPSHTPADTRYDVDVIHPLLLTASLLSGCAKHSHSSINGIVGPEVSVLPLYRSYEDSPRIYVEADLGDGVPRFFLVDTGASVTTITAEIAEELDLTVQENGGWLVGVSGQTRWQRATLDTVTLGKFTVEDISVGVGVEGVPTTAGVVPLAGLMGNNVWHQFQLDLDYVGGTMTLARPGQLPVPENAHPMHFDSQHITTDVILRFSTGDRTEDKPLTVTVDTGAGGLLLSGHTVAGLEPHTSTGVEPIYGVGAGDDLPVSNFLRQTRRLPVTSVDIGGTLVERPLEATWLPGRGLSSLLGHEILEGHRVFIDYQAGLISLTESDKAPEQPDIHDRYLAVLRRQRGGDMVLKRVEVLAWKRELDEASRVLSTYVHTHPDDDRAAIMLASLTRHRGDPAAALHQLSALPVSVLVTEGALLSAVNGLWLEDRAEEARALAQQAVEAEPNHPLAWIALSDISRASRDFATARSAIRQANQLEQNPDGHLLRRAWIASEEGDHYAAITHIRRLIELHPSGAVAPWFYALQVEDTEQVDLFLADLDRAQRRLHPGDGPLDFLAGAYQVIGRADLAASIMAVGLERDCHRTEVRDAADIASRDNCEAWYRALVHQDLDNAHALSQQAVADHPSRSEYLDTLAVVLEARGELAAARDAAWQAATLDPDDVYLLWQAARLQRAVMESGS
ncbi:MAG: tetratricopeptide (TPR) repeat protein [Myxococcota bacterium]|jgi:tetratricopeptide (TPR) repeat protein